MKKRQYLPHNCSDKGFKQGYCVDQTLSSLHGGSLEITRTVPFNNLNPTKKHLDRDEVDEDQLLILLHPLITFLKCISGWITQFKSMLYLWRPTHIRYTKLLTYTLEVLQLLLEMWPGPLASFSPGDCPPILSLPSNKRIIAVVGQILQ